MKKRSESEAAPPSLRDKIIGLGERSIRKSYFPQLQQQLEEVEKSRIYLEEKSAALLNMLEDLEEGRKKLAASEAQLRAIVETTPDCIMLIAADGTLLEVNEAGLKMIECESAEVVIGQWLYPMIAPEFQEAFRSFNESVFRGNQGIFQFEIIGLKGTRRWLETHAVPLRNPSDGTPIQLAVTRDITERKQVEEALSAERGLFVSGPTVVFKWKAQEGWPVEYVSSNVVYQFGYAPEEFTSGKVHYAAIVHPDDLARVAAEVSAYSEQGVASFEQIYRIAHIDGRYRWIDDFTTVIRGRDGVITHYLGYVLDITDRKQAEETLRQSEELLRVTLTNILDPVFITDDDGKLTFICPNVLSTLGYSVEEIQAMGNISKLVGDGLFNPEELERRGEIINIERLMVDNFGRQRVFLVNVKRVSIGEGTRLYALHDITERKRAEKALRRLNRELRAISSCNQTLLRAVDEQTLLNDICRIVCDKAGYRLAWVGYAENDDAKTVRPVAWAGFDNGYLEQARLTWADTERGRAPTGTSIRRGESVCIQDFTTDPQAAPWRENALQRGYRSNIALPLKDENAKTFGALTIYSMEPNAFTLDEKRLLEELAGDLAFGITTLRTRAERKRAEESLWESSQMLKLVLDNMPAFVFWKDRNSVYLGCNHLFAANAGLSFPQEIIGLTDLDLPWKYAEAASYRADDQRVMETGIPKLNYEETQLTADGRVTEVRTSKIPLRNPEGDVIGVLGTFEDITERKRAEQERLAHLHFFKSMDRVNRAMQGTNDLEQMMRDVLDVVLSIFDCDRAWLLYPLEPGIPTWQAPIERTRLKSPGALASGSEIPVDPDLIRLLRTAQDSSVVVQSSPGSEYQVPAEIAKQFSIQSQLTMAVYPKVDNPYLFGLHQCSYPRVWTPQEERLFQEIGRRLSDALTSLLMLRHLQESEAKFSTTFRSSPSALSVSTAKDHVYVDVNDSFLQWTGYTQAEVMGHTSIELKLWAEPDQDREFRRLLHEHGSVYNFEYAYRRKDGDVRYALVSATFITIGGEPCVLAQSNDITERKQAEARILRLNRLYATLSQINQTIVHVRDREKLFREICRVAVEHGQFRLAWISLIDEATYRVEPVASAGEEQGYLTAIAITSQDEPLGRGPTGTAIREGRCMLCQDIATDARMLPWRDQSLQRGYRSSAAVPFWQHGRVVGALTVYAAEPQSFDAEDEQLLDEIGQDISFALDVLEQEAQRRQVEAELSQLNAELEQRVIDRTTELARAHEHLRAILDTAGEGVVFTDLQGTIEYINPAMERLTGYTAEEALGRNPRLWKSDQTPLTVHQRMWGALTRGEIWQGELVNRRKDGRLYDAALTAAPLTNPEGQTVGFVGVQRDITRQKELDRMKDQFVSNVSHELRTPLANVLLHIGLLEHGKPDKRDSYLRTLRREAERLRKMIEDLLDLSRLDRNVVPIQLVPIDLQQLLEQLITDRAALAEQHGLTLTYESTLDLPLVLTDAAQLIQVASNLLTNALNYTPARGVVSVGAEVRRHGGQKMVAFTVRDTGPGIAAQDMPHLFERFYRGAAGRQASAPGTGLGLAISQEIMERLGGRITIESETGHGAAFTVWLPLA